MHHPQKRETRPPLDTQGWLFLSAVVHITMEGSNYKQTLQRDFPTCHTSSAKAPRSCLSLICHPNRSWHPLLNPIHFSFLLHQEKEEFPNKFPFLVTCISLQSEIHSLMPSMLAGPPSHQIPSVPLLSWALPQGQSILKRGDRNSITYKET